MTYNYEGLDDSPIIIGHCAGCKFMQSKDYCYGACGRTGFIVVPYQSCASWEAKE